MLSVPALEEKRFFSGRQKCRPNAAYAIVAGAVRTVSAPGTADHALTVRQEAMRDALTARLCRRAAPARNQTSR